jgi:uncharacterized protein involved in response to NO
MSAGKVLPADRSLPRAAIKHGDLSRDGRGRIRATPPILSYGFRPFFFLAAVHAGIAIPLWLVAFSSGFALPGAFEPLHWHAHEMLFGFLAAVMTGFLLTAIPNWTGRLPLSGGPLAMLVGLWIAGRLGVPLIPHAVAAMAIDLSFPLALAFVVAREVIAGRNWRNAPVAGMVALMALANAVDHLDGMGVVPHDLGQRLALAVAAMMLALIGGRIVPSFTRNWFAKQKAAALPAPFGRLDRAALLVTGPALVTWVALPDAAASGAMLVAAAALLARRLARWRGARTVREPILFVLHVGYGWLAAAMLLLGLSSLTTAVPPSAAVHALTTGAIGTMTLAVMTRASLGHTGRPIVADRAIVGIYVLVSLGALLRVTAPFAGHLYLPLLAAGGASWSGAFVLFAIRYAPLLWGRPTAG